jgi:hypothetical protein
VGNIYSDSNLSVQYTTENPSNTWAQVGGDLHGEASGDYFGFSVALSSDGTRLAVGGYLNDGGGTDSGHVRVFDLVGGAWTKVGDNIDGEAAGDRFGYSVALSSDGSRLAVGAYKNDSGYVRVFNWSGSAWIQLGADIDGEATGDWYGFSVALSSDGSRLAVGGNQNDGGGTDAGHVRVFEYHQGSSTWIQLGVDIDGEAAGDRLGFSVALSSDGTRLASGAPYNDGTGTDAGHVRVFNWSGSVWTQVGADIDGEAAGDQFGYSVALSSDGSRLAVGSNLNDGTGTDAGHVRVFDWSGSAWSQVGGDIDGEAAGDYFGFSVALSSDGSRLAVGARLNDGGGTDSGHVRVFDLVGGTWTQVGGDLDGVAAGDRFASVALSSDGSRLAAGSQLNDSGGTTAGHARVFDYDGVLKTKQIIKEDIVEIPGDLRAGCPVYFSVSKDTDSEFGSLTNLVFPIVQTNKGGGYTPSTGYFTAPIAGTYFFIFNATTRNDGDNNAGRFRINDVEVSQFRNDAIDNDIESVSHHDIVYLNMGDFVNITVTGHLSINPQYFSGFYLSS